MSDGRSNGRLGLARDGPSRRTRSTLTSVAPGVADRSHTTGGASTRGDTDVHPLADPSRHVKGVEEIDARTGHENAREAEPDDRERGRREPREL